MCIRDRKNVIQWAQHAIESTQDAKSILSEGEILPGERCGIKSAVSKSVVAEERGLSLIHICSCEASATNCRCCIHAVSTGLTAHRESRMRMPRNTRKLSAPMKPQVPSRAFSVARSLEISANTRQWFSGISER